MMLWMPSRRSGSRSSSLDATAAAEACLAAVADLQDEVLIKPLVDELEDHSEKYNCIKAYTGTRLARHAIRLPVAENIPPCCSIIPSI